MSHDRDADRAANDPAVSDLEAAFAALRAAPPAPSADLVARVLADADRVSARPRVFRKAPTRGLAGLWAALGGWAGGAGLATATLAGLAIGFGAPDVLSGVTGTGLSDDAAVAAWLWPDVGLVMDGLTAAEEG
ncbi:MAG: dihydroorotate dehydrogenase [Rhodobacteraceae bacterium]|jgi:hypothetical protein|nr:dihydroorotate dehydrogenase [Paracoccaceae bacterium]